MTPSALWRSSPVPPASPWAALAESHERRGDVTAALATLDSPRRQLAPHGLDLGLQLQEIRGRLTARPAPRRASESSLAPGDEPRRWVADFLDGAMQMAESQHWPPFGTYDRHLLARVADGTVPVSPAVRGQALALLHVENRLPARALIRRAVAEERARSEDGCAELLDHLSWFRLGHDAAEVADWLCDLGRADPTRPALGLGLVRAWSAAVQCGVARFDDATRAASLRAAVDACAAPALRWAVTLWEATRAMATGDLAGAARLAAASEELIGGTGVDGADPLPRDAVIATAGQCLAIAFMRGDLASIDTALARMQTWSTAGPPLAPARAVLAAYQGRPEEARGLIDALVADGLLHQRRSSVTLVSLILVAAATHALHDAERAEAVLRGLDAYRGDHGLLGKSPYFGAAVHHMGMLCGVVGDWDHAAELLDESVDVHRRAGAASFTAMSSWQLARALHRRGRVADRGRAERLRVAAQTDAERFGLTILRGAAAAGFR